RLVGLKTIKSSSAQLGTPGTEQLPLVLMTIRRLASTATASIASPLVVKPTSDPSNPPISYSSSKKLKRPLVSGPNSYGQKMASSCGSIGCIILLVVSGVGVNVATGANQ